MSDKKKPKAAGFAMTVFKGKLKKASIEIDTRGSRVDDAVDSMSNGDSADELRIKKGKKK